MSPGTSTSPLAQSLGEHGASAKCPALCPPKLRAESGGSSKEPNGAEAAWMSRFVAFWRVLSPVLGARRGAPCFFRTCSRAMNPGKSTSALAQRLGEHRGSAEGQGVCPALARGAATRGAGRERGEVCTPWYTSVHRGTPEMDFCGGGESKSEVRSSKSEGMSKLEVRSPKSGVPVWTSEGGVAIPAL